MERHGADELSNNSGHACYCNTWNQKSHVMRFAANMFDGN